MRTNRGKNKGKGNKGKNNANIALYVVPVIVLITAGWGVYELFLKKPAVSLIAEYARLAPIEPTKEDIYATIYFDNSISMKGYASANPNHYLDVVADLRSFYPGTNAYIGDEEIPGDKLIDRIRLNQIDYTKESLLYRDLELIASHAQHILEDSLQRKEVLNFYITDGIMSGSDDDIRKDGEYNKIHAQDLQNQIRDALRGKDSIGLSLYQFKSKFDGIYWAYDNENHKLNNAPLRFFYVIAIGSRPTLANFKQKVDSLSSDVSSKFHPIAQWHAIDNHVINTDLSVGPNGAVNIKGNAYLYKPEVINRNGGFITFNLDSRVLCNQYVENMDSLASVSFIEINGRRVSNILISFDKKAHAFTFKLPSVNLAKQISVRLTIPRRKYEWIEASTNEDDKYMFNMPDLRTFLFDKFMQGIQSGISGASSPYIYQREVILKQE